MGEVWLMHVGDHVLCYWVLLGAMVLSGRGEKAGSRHIDATYRSSRSYRSKRIGWGRRNRPRSFSPSTVALSLPLARHGVGILSEQLRVSLVGDRHLDRPFVCDGRVQFGTNGRFLRSCHSSNRHLRSYRRGV